MDVDEIRADIAAFADREEDVVFDNGMVVYERDRQTVECTLLQSPGGDVNVQLNGRTIPYSRFIGEELGRLSVLAEAIKQKRPDVAPYVDTQATLVDDSGSKDEPTSALELLRERCGENLFGETRLIFLTADAGEGKTALLRRLTRSVADRYTSGKSAWLLLHVDTQGRSFVRLEEAVAKDLGQLRISGLFYSGIIRLVRHGLVKIAVDGFDELLAEIGSGEAYSGLGAFLKQLDGRGTVIAAARSAYFESENYTAQSHLLSSLPDTQVSVEQMKLERWRRNESAQFFQNFRNSSGGRIENPVQVYDDLASELGDEHVVLHSPFLVLRLAMILAEKLMTPEEIKEEIGDSGFSVVPRVIKSFLEREVAEKWRDQNGQPYLSMDQHIELLSMIAEEMWYQSTDSLPLDVVQLVAETLMEDWDLTQSSRVQVIERVKAHALLPVSTTPGHLSFDHEGFLNYFLAERLDAMMEDRSHDNPLRGFLERHPLPKIAGKWVSVIRTRSADESSELIRFVSSLAANEVRSTYIKQNAGLIAANVASACTGMPEVTLEAMYFEGDEWKESHLSHVTFKRCNFIDIVLSGCVWEHCHFTNCQIDGMTYDSATSLKGSQFDESCRVLGILKDERGSSTFRTYVLDRCQAILESLGAGFLHEQTFQHDKVRQVKADVRNSLDAFLRIFSRTTGTTDRVINTKLGKRAPLFRSAVLPVLIKYGLVRRTQYRGGGQQNRYELAYPVEQILKSENPDAPLPRNLVDFWETLRLN